MTEGLVLQFSASIHSLKSEGKNLATFYIMNTSPNLNRWAVSEKALEEALPTLLGKPLGCIPGYRVNHVHQPLQVGRWVKVEKPDGYALGTAEVTDSVAWEKVGSGEWGPVSVVIRAFRVSCSLCQADITDAPDVHVLSGEAYEVVESFVFDRVDFVSEPAYPQAGILGFSKSASNLSGSSLDEVSGTRDENPKPDELNSMEEVGKEVEVLKAENLELKAAVQRLEAERHQEKVNRAVEARLRAGLVKDKIAEEEKLKALDGKALAILEEDAEVYSSKNVKTAGPKAQYIAGNEFDAAVEDTRMRLFGHRREA